MNRTPTRRQFTAAAASLNLAGLAGCSLPGAGKASPQDRAADTVLEPERRTKVRARVDVVVCGGGPAGFGAAIAAARNGAHTLLLENLGCLGGNGGSGMLNRLGPYHDQEKMIVGGIPLEVLQRLVAMKAALMPNPVPWGGIDGADYWAPFDPEALKILLDTMVAESHVKVLFNARVVGAIVQGGRVEGVFIESKSGREAVLAKIVIDATGDGDVAASAGAPFEKGRPGDGGMQPITLMSKVHNLNRDKALKYFQENKAKILAAARGRGEIVPHGAGPGTDNLLRADETYYNVDHVRGADGTDVEEVTKAWIEARKQVWAIYRFNRRYLPDFKNVYLAGTGALLGVRETRRILGGYVLTGEDVLEARKFPDGIFRYACYIDIHAVGRPGREKAYNRKIPKAGTSYEIPYRCLVPRNIENLLVAGRCFSATHEGLASARMMPSCMGMGQAAGTAAAIAADKRIAPRELDGVALRKVLIAQGVTL